MSRADEHGQQERADRGIESYMVGMLAQRALGYLNEPVHSAGSLQHGCAGDGSYDDVDDIRRGSAGLHAEAENENREAYAGNGAQRKGTVPGAHVKGSKDDEELDDHQCHGCSVSELSWQR